MSEHETIRELLPLAAAGALDDAELLRVERHAHSCPACRKELDTWAVYTNDLRGLPQPSMPEGLMEKTLARMLEQQAAAAGRHWNAGLLVALGAFGWIVTAALWILVRDLSGGTWTWPLLSMMLLSVAAASAAALLAKRRESEGELRRTYEPF
jgi:anti-sigma factor RsiW